MSARAYFGTDGIRGQANRHPMTAEVALRVGLAAGRLFRSGGDRRHLVVIGKDTRLSGYMIEPALVAGFASVGMDVRTLGPLPTPGVAMMTRSMRADLGVMISASHNNFADNGIKLFGPDGYKLSDEIELRSKSLMDEGLEEGLAEPAELGRVVRIDDSQARYIEIVKPTFPRRLSLNGLRVVIDCANGAAYKVAPTVLYELGAEVKEVGVTPNGLNINLECGSTYPKTLAKAVREYRADIGIALDGDADRLLICDERGEVVDGDEIMAIIAADWAASDRLKGGGVVSTVYSNLGLERFLAERRPKPRAYRGRRPLRHGPHARGRLQHRRRAVGPRHPVGLLDHRRRSDRGPAGAGGARAVRQADERSGPPVRAGAADAWRTCASPTAPSRSTTPPSRRRSPTARPG